MRKIHLRAIVTLLGLGAIATHAQPQVSKAPAASVPPAVSTNVVKPRVNSGTPNFIGKFSNSTDLVNSALYEVNGNVGISTTNPLISLDVRTGSLPQMGIAGTTDYLTFFASDAFGPAIYWDPAKDMRFGKGGASLYNPFGFIEQMRIQSSTGNVGIGTMTPSSKLDVVGDINFSGILRSQGASILQFPGGIAGQNVALGFAANAAGTHNTSIGNGALAVSTSGDSNTAIGRSALTANTTGTTNTAVGSLALQSNINGTNNIAIGQSAGMSVAAGNSNNIHIGNVGASADNATIRIGDTAVQTAFFAAGIRGVTTGANDAIPVMIDSAGQLGTVSSSRRFKEDIQDMGEASRDLMHLRPVTFRYKQPFADGSKPIQYGLIAEEVDEVYPELVAHSADGRIETVKYQVLDTMLLNEFQHQQSEIVRLENKIDLQNQRRESLLERLAQAEAVLASVSASRKR